MPEEIGEGFERRAEKRVEAFAATQPLGEGLEFPHRLGLGNDLGAAFLVHRPAIEDLVDVHPAQSEHAAHSGLRCDGLQPRPHAIEGRSVGLRPQVPQVKPVLIRGAGRNDNHLCAGVLLHVLPSLVEELKGKPHMVLVQAVDDGEKRHVRQTLAGARAHGCGNHSFETRRNAVERNAESADLAHNGEPASGPGVWLKICSATNRILTITGDPASSRCHRASMKGSGTPMPLFT